MMGKYENFTPYKQVKTTTIYITRELAASGNKTTKASADTKQHNFMHIVSNH
jgi:hypothetical protein